MSATTDTDVWAQFDTRAVALVFQPVGSGDFAVARITGQEFPANPQTWKSALPCRIAPCAAGRLLLKTRSAMVKRAMMAQKVLLLGRWLETGPVTSNPHRSGFKRDFDNEYRDFKTPWSFERKSFRAGNSTTEPHERTQSAPNQ